MNYFQLLQQLIPEAVLVITALAVIALSAGSRRDPSLPESATGAAALAAAGILLACLGLLLAPAQAAQGMISVDPLSRLFRGVILLLGLLAIAVPPQRGEIRYPREYYALSLFGLAGLLLVAGTEHMLLLFVGLELAGLSFYLLAGFSFSVRAAEASLKYFLFGGVSAAFLLFGLSLLYGFSGTLDLQGMAAAIYAQPFEPFAIAGLAMVLVGLGFKLAAAPFHFWAPDVYEAAPAGTVALIAGASKAAAVVALLKILILGFGPVAGSAAWNTAAPGWAPLIAGMAALSIVLGNLFALAQTSVRRMLAYSSIAHAGYLLVALGSPEARSSSAVLFYVVVYSLATLGAFAVTAAVERQRGSDSIQSFAGLVHRSPGLALALLVFLASLAGIPPLAGFFGKFALFGAALAASADSGLLWLIVIAAGANAISLYYYLRVLKEAFVRPAEAAAEARSPLSASLGLAVAVPALLLILLGLFPDLLLDPIGTAAATLR